MTQLDPIEIATGIVFGLARRPAAFPEPRSLEAAVLPALSRGRCYVSFSGGRDSSAVLAAATAAARREGLPLPVPVTIRAPHEPESDESAWQHRVIGHLGLEEWIRIEVDDELDAVGPYARSALTAHGLLWPFNAHFHVPLLEQAAGGTLLTGVGGDELWSAAHAPRVRRRRRVLGYAPYSLRRAVLARREPIGFPWLRPAAVRAARRAAGGDSAAEPRTARSRMAWWRAMRSTAMGTDALALLAADAGAEIAHPLLDGGVWATVAAAAPRLGFPRRSDAFRAVAGHLLPEDVAARPTKAAFNRVFFHGSARAFVRDWGDTGIPHDLVDVAALRAHWLGEAPDPHSLTLLQAAWLASTGDRVEQPLGRGAE